MDGWTQVRYGWRRKQGNQPPLDQSSGRSTWRKDRAPPSSFGRRNFLPFPNRPVPPPKTDRYTGPQSRSYADVVRQNNPQPARRSVSPRVKGLEVRREPASPQFGKLVRKLYGVIRMVHHLQNVAPKPGKAEPRMISRMVEILSEMIKPAAPTPDTVEMIIGNAKNWGHNTYLILMEHYETSIEELLEELLGLLTPDWKEAFEVAVRWARRNLRRITRDEIDHAEALIMARSDGTDTMPAQIPQQASNKVQTQGKKQSTVRSSVATMTGQEKEAAQEPEWYDCAPRAESPQEQREERRNARRSRGVVFTEDNLFRVEEAEVMEEQGGPTHTSTRLESESFLQEVQAEDERQETRVKAAKMVHTSIQTTAQVHQGADAEELRAQGVPTAQTPTRTNAQAHQDADSDEEPFQESFDRFTSPMPQRFRVYRHPNTQRKLTDWELVVLKKVVFLGDSNLCNMPDYYNRDLQIDSFPGAHFRHAQALMEKTEPTEDLVVETIVLSFGMNSRGNKSKETTIKSVQGAIRSTRRKFPYASIWIPLVNFSSALPEEEKENLQTLNDHVERNMAHIPLLPAEKFQTEGDDVHWTAETGRAMFDHWMAFLNSRAP